MGPGEGLCFVIVAFLEYPHIYFSRDLIKPTLRFFSVLVLCFKRQSFRVLLYFTAADVKCHVAAVKRLSVLHRSADYIFIFFRITEPI